MIYDTKKISLLRVLSMKKILLLVVAFSSLSCMERYKTIEFGNVSLSIPKNMQRQSISVDEKIIELNSIYDSLFYKNNNAAYTVIYSKYRDEYKHLYNLYSAARSAVISMKNNPSFKEFKVISSEEVSISGVRGVITTTEFVYGIHKTMSRSLILVDDYMLQIICIYTKSHKGSENTIDKIIKSVKINE